MSLLNNELDQLHNQVLLPGHLKYLLLCVDVPKGHFPVTLIRLLVFFSDQIKVLGQCFCPDCFLSHLQGIVIFSVVVGTLDAFIVFSPFFYWHIRQLLIDCSYLRLRVKLDQNADSDLEGPKVCRLVFRQQGQKDIKHGAYSHFT